MQIKAWVNSVKTRLQAQVHHLTCARPGEARAVCSHLNSPYKTPISGFCRPPWSSAVCLPCSDGARPIQSRCARKLSSRPSGILTEAMNQYCEIHHQVRLVFVNGASSQKAQSSTFPDSSCYRWVAKNSESVHFCNDFNEAPEKCGDRHKRGSCGVSFADYA